MWGKFIYDYQTLITGVLAVFAAGVAVSQSVTADAAQERRHRQQMDLSQRRDLFAVRRLTNDLSQRLSYVADRSNEFSTYDLPTTTDGWAREARTVYLSLLTSASRLFDKLNSVGDLERGLFDTQLDVAFVLYRRQLEEFFNHFPDRASGFPDMYPNSDHAPARFDQGIRSDCIGLEAETRAFRLQLQRWQAEIEGVYKI